MTKSKKILIISVIAALVLGLSVTGTLAYLTDRSENVVNTFTAMGDGELVKGEFSILETPLKAAMEPDGRWKLDEGAAPVKENHYSVLPGVDLPKDTYVTISDKTEVPSYLYLEVLEENVPDFCSWEMLPQWKILNNLRGPNGGLIYYLENDGTYTRDNGLIDDKTGDLSHINVIQDNVIKVDLEAETNTVSEEGFAIKFWAYLAQASAAPADSGNKPFDVFEICFSAT